jgi:hypothetical protein
MHNVSPPAQAYLLSIQQEHASPTALFHSGVTGLTICVLPIVLQNTLTILIAHAWLCANRHTMAIL